MSLTQAEADQLREWMVERQIAERGVRDPAVLAAMRAVPRHVFVPPSLEQQAYADGPLPIGHGQTISQPYIVASMTEELRVGADSRVLEVGTGSGYQTAVLAEICREVYTIEIVPELHRHAREVLERLGYSNIHFKLGDGSLGWPEHAPYDGIIVTAAARDIPAALVEQLAEGGRLVIPLQGPGFQGQSLYVVTREQDRVKKHYLYDVRFVPLRSASSEPQ